MTHSIERKNGDLVITVNTTKEESDKLYSAVVKELAAEVTVPGFRKGKAPLELASRRISADQVNDRLGHRLLDRAFHSFLYDPAVILILEAEVPTGAVPSASFGENGSVIFTYPLLPVVETLGTYQGLKTEVIRREVTDEDVENELKRLASEESDLTPTDEPIENGFTANCDIHGSIAGVERPEVSEKGFDIKVGSAGSIPGLSEKLVGHKVGENVSCDIEMPNNYPDEVAGKTVHFEVRINSVKKVVEPAIDDELATLQTEYEGVDNLEQLKGKIRERLSARFVREYENAKLSKILTECNKTTKYVMDEPRLREALVNHQRQQDEEMLKGQGFDLNTYLKLVNMDLKTYSDNVYRNLISGLQSAALQRAIAKAVNLPAPTEAEVREACEKNRIDYDQVRKSIAENFHKEFKTATDEQAAAMVDVRFAGIIDSLESEKLRTVLLDSND